MKKISQFSVFIFFIMLISCKPDVRNDEDMKFNVVDSLIEQEINMKSLGIEFAPPVNFRSDVSNLNVIQNQFRRLEAFKNLKVEDIFIDRSNSALMIISDISGIQDSIINDIVRNSDILFADTATKTKVLTDDYNYNGFKVHQVLIQNPQFVNFKLFYLEGTDKAFEVDFITPKATYQNITKAIESSLGTFKSD